MQPEWDDFESVTDYDINENLLKITTHTQNDFFTGIESKQIFKRDYSCIDKRLHYELELFFYHKHHIRPHLETIVSGNDSKFFFFLAAEIEFSKENNDEDTCTRWSSWRNRSCLCFLLLSLTQ